MEVATHDFIGEVFAAVAKCLDRSGCPLTDEQRAVLDEAAAIA